MPAAFEIKEADVENNIEVIKSRAGVPVWGVVKFDGYGTGLLFMAEKLREAGVTRLAVAEASDVVALREAGFESEEILLLRPLAEDSELAAAVEYDATFSVGSLKYARRLELAALRAEKTLRAHIVIDTGLGRYGFMPDEYDSVKGLYTGARKVEYQGIYSHFSSAYGDRAETERQFGVFTGVLERLAADGIERGMAHMACSSAMFRHDDMMLDAVRVGSALVGRVGGTDPAETMLRPIGTLAVPVVEVKYLPKGHPVGYGCSTRTRRTTRVAILPVGQWDGVPLPGLRAKYLHRGVPVADICGSKAPFLGAPGEGQTFLDVTDVEAAVGNIARLNVNPLRIGGSVTKAYL